MSEEPDMALDSTRVAATELETVVGARLPEGERAAAGRLAALAQFYIDDPFTHLETARARLGLDRAEFARHLELFDSVPELRRAVTQGPTGKYWDNTFLPLEASGAIDAVLAGRTAFPHRVGLYPGPTCMFRCSFCIRVTGARYEARSVTPGNEMFAALIDEAPTDDPYRFYLSGGLEPLTNPGLGELITHAAGRGFRLSCYSNSFALTEQALIRQPGLWNLHALRTSLYGTDEAEYQATTTKKGAYERVKNNIKNLLRMRRDRGSDLRVGFNYVVLPGQVARLHRLIDLFAEINEAAPDRPVDFLTLREDYSGEPDGRISPVERAELQETLLAFEEYAARRTPTLNVDYGYALNSLRQGKETKLLRITPQTMRPAAHPQVAVQVDVLGDVYLYREAGFPGLPGADRYIAGRVTPQTGLREVIGKYLAEDPHIVPAQGDEFFLDGFDQAVTARLSQLEADTAAGWAAHRGLLHHTGPVASAEERR
ncbi:dTDP-4-amino-4,6-dideoxy-D-glucose ammonia-lyase [Streptomyces sp. NPDC059122]|uniref:dTDP-4-amino-4,6-dideoxy-D-glucose ammonia-lyase n=1 Tax=Streptomyces sp. NPDC059122 TaxID=3346732 RepID=UPI00368322FE